MCKKTDPNITVSVVVPVYNEYDHIKPFINCLIGQDFPREQMEWIFVDGGSNDCTQDIINASKLDYPDTIRLENNPKKIVPYAMNIGISAAKGKYIVRMDAHTEYPKNYISKSVYYIENTDADNVGGIVETRANGFTGSAIAKMLSSPFGVGNSNFRIGAEDGYVDTVPFGTFRRELFSKYGGFDERLVRNQDNEINYRIRKNGGKVYMTREISSVYYCRDTIKGICKMANANGRWNMVSMKVCPGSMGIRHLIPFCFVLSLIGLPLLSLIFPIFRVIYLIELLIYFGIDLFFSIKQGDSIKQSALLFVLFPMFHISYGAGSLIGITSLFGNKYNRNYQPPII